MLRRLAIIGAGAITGEMLAVLGRRLPHRLESLTVLARPGKGAAVEQAALFFVVLPGVQDRLHDRLRRSAFHHPLAGEVGREAHPLDRAHALDVVGVGGQQLLGDQLPPSACRKAATVAAHERPPSSVAELHEDQRADAALAFPAARTHLRRGPTDVPARSRGC